MCTLANSKLTRQSPDVERRLGGHPPQHVVGLHQQRVRRVVIYPQYDLVVLVQRGHVVPPVVAQGVVRGESTLDPNRVPVTDVDRQDDLRAG